MPFYKIASADLNNFPLIEKIISKNKPIVLSTGACKISEINKTVKFIKSKNKDILLIVLHCVLSYPTGNNDAHLELIKVLKKFPRLIIGYSDHTLPDQNMMILTSAYLNGAMVIEKHFSDTKGVKGNDHFHSLDKEDLIKFRRNIDIYNSVNKDLKNRYVLNCEKNFKKKR